MIALTTVVIALMLRAGYPPAMAVVAGVCVGGLVGLVNGLVITGLRVVPFIATLGMLANLVSLCQAGQSPQCGELLRLTAPLTVNDQCVARSRLPEPSRIAALA